VARWIGDPKRNRPALLLLIFTSRVFSLPRYWIGGRLRLTTPEAGDSLLPMVPPTYACYPGGVMRKPYNIPTSSLLFDHSVGCQSIDGMSGWDVMPTRCHI
jgi:hypothetical protein